MTSELSLEFMTGNPQLGVLSGRLRYINTNGSAASKEEDGEDEGEEDDEEETVENGRHAKVLSTSSVSPTDLPEHRGTILCILSVPAHMIPTDILQFVAPFKRHVHFVRILRPCNPVGPSDPARTPTDWSTCVICMDRMECHVLTTVCNHSFHVECLVKWQDSPCPVCRYHHNNASEASTCQECQASDNLWVCLICGDVLCGSRHLDHVRLHYTSTLHAYALDIETQQVWDFAGDGFVHRLIHNKADGKLVEIPDPRQTSEERPQFPARLSDVQEERLIHGKLEGLAYQYNTLLTSQLDEQRHFYEKQLNELLEQQEKKRRERREKIISGAGLISALRQQRRELENKCASAAERLKKVRDETAFLLEVNESLEANREQWSTSLEQARQDLETAKRIRELRVPEMERKVEQLMLRLDAATTGSSAGSRNATSNSGVGDATGAISERRRDPSGVAAAETSVSEGGGEGFGETKRTEDSGKEADVAVGQRDGEAVGTRGGSREQTKERGGSGATASGQQGHNHKKKAKRKKGR